MHSGKIVITFQLHLTNLLVMSIYRLLICMLPTQDTTRA